MALTGESNTAENPTDPLSQDPNQITVDPSQMCPHNSVFYSAPNAQAVIQQQTLEMQAAQAAQAAQQATQSANTPIPETE